jgi:hypothetical protein
MRRRLTRAVVLAAICSLAVASAASACSYAVAPGVTQDELDVAGLRASDGAFIGTALATFRGSAGVTYLFGVQRAVKGSFPTGFVVVRSNLTSCGLYARVGERTGLMVDRRGGRWRADDIDRIAPRDLLRAARRG